MFVLKLLCCMGLSFGALDCMYTSPISCLMQRFCFFWWSRWRYELVIFLKKNGRQKRPSYSPICFFITTVNFVDNGARIHWTRKRYIMKLDNNCTTTRNCSYLANKREKVHYWNLITIVPPPEAVLIWYRRFFIVLDHGQNGSI